ncbi:MAG TPA: aminopeptidase P family protein [Firmicutes bacterium]|nr:aminopeptidase P family protein [Bacillota bacterium]
MNTARFTELASSHGYAAAVATTVPNVFYSTGCISLGQRLIAGTKVFSVVVPRTDPTLVLPVGEADLAVEIAQPGAKVLPYGVFYLETGNTADSQNDRKLAELLKAPQGNDPIQVLASLLRELDLEGKTVAVDETGLTPWEWERLSELTRARLVPGASFWKEVRMVKTADEVAKLRQAALITSAAMDYCVANAKEGMTEKDMAAVYEKYLIEHGAGLAATVILFGPHSAYPNGIPGERKLRKGDIIRFDSGCVYQGYYADLARIVLFGRPDQPTLDKVSAYHSAILAGMERAIATIKPRVRVSEIFHAAVETVRANGVHQYKRTHCGHGIGVEIYDPPVLREDSNAEIEPGMVFCVETPYYELGLGGIQVEDTIVVTEDGIQYLSPPTVPLQII